MPQETRDLSRFAWLSIAAALVTITLKTVAWQLTGSVGLLSDAAESVVNLVAAVAVLIALRVAAMPADKNHHFGHAKAEYFSAALEGMMIFVAALVILYTSVDRFLHPRPIENVGIGLAVSVLASVVNGVVAVILLRAGRQYRSLTLTADGKHLLTDVWTSAGVIVGVGLAAATGWLWLDPVVAIGVALNILREGVQLVWRSSQGLMDEALEPEVIAEIEQTLAQFKHRTIRFDHVSSRRSGSRRFVDLHMHMPADWTLGRAAAVRSSVEQALMSAVPGLRCTIQLLPMDVEAHFDDEEDLI